MLRPPCLQELRRHVAFFRKSGKFSMAYLERWGGGRKRRLAGCSRGPWLLGPSLTPVPHTSLNLSRPFPINLQGRGEGVLPRLRV
jgi:hypothetical protein